MGLGVLMNHDNTVNCAGGFIVQVMPFVEETVLAKLRIISKHPICDRDAERWTYTGRDVSSGSGGTGSGSDGYLADQILLQLFQGTD